jgi:predicted metal-dependent phosphoesterase TrpH
LIIDLHVHTVVHSSDSVLKIPEMVEKARKSGLDGVCLTEHGYFWDEERLAELSWEHDFLLLPGIELTSDDSHFLVFGLKEYSFGLWMAWKLRETIEDIGGAMVLAHPSRRQYSGNGDIEEDLERYCRQSFLKHVNFIEEINGRSPDTANEFSRELCRRLGVRGTGGSDAHAVDDFPSAATEFEREIHSLEDLVAELRAGRFRPVDLRNGSGNS